MRAAEAIRVSTSCRPSPRPAPDGLPVRGLAAGGVLLGELHVVGLRGAAASVATPKGARARSSRDASCELRAVTAVDAGRRASMTRRPISAPWLWISCMAACSEVDHRRGSISPRRHRFDVPPDPVSLCVDGSELLVGADPGGLHDARDRLFRDLDHGGQLARGRGAGGRLLRVARFDRWRIRAPALDQLPITLDELLELDSHAPAGRIAASDPPDSSSARSCSRLSVASAVACCKCSACCRRSSSRLADPARAARSCSSLPEDGFLGVAQLGVHLLELAAQGDELRLHRPRAERPLARDPRSASRGASPRYRAVPRAPPAGPASRRARRRGAFGALLRRTRVLRGPVEHGVPLGERRPNARRAVSEEPALQVGHGWSPLRRAVAWVVRGLCARPRGGSNISHRFWLRPRRHRPRPIWVGGPSSGPAPNRSGSAGGSFGAQRSVLDQPGVVRGGRSIRRPVPAPLRGGFLARASSTPPGDPLTGAPSCASSSTRLSDSSDAGARAVLAGECGELGERRQPNTQLFDGVGEGATASSTRSPIPAARSPASSIVDRTTPTREARRSRHAASRSISARVSRRARSASRSSCPAWVPAPFIPAPFIGAVVHPAVSRTTDVPSAVTEGSGAGRAATSSTAARAPRDRLRRR